MAGLRISSLVRGISEDVLNLWTPCTALVGFLKFNILRFAKLVGFLKILFIDRARIAELLIGFPNKLFTQCLTCRFDRITLYTFYFRQSAQF